MKRGFAPQILTVLFIMLLLIMGLVIYFLYGLIAPVASYTINDITNELVGIPNTDNVSTYLNYTFGSANQIVQNTEWITYGILTCAFIVFLVMCYYVRTYPVLIFIWLLVGLVLIFTGMLLSESYSTIINDGGYLTSAYASWQGNDIIMQNLPLILGGFILLGGIIMFALITRDKDEELLL